MSTKQREILRSLTNADEPIKESSPLIKHEPIPGTPFWIIGNDEQGWYIRYGTYSIIEKQKTEKEAYDRLEIDKWDICSRIAGIVTEKAIEDHVTMLLAKMNAFGEIQKKDDPRDAEGQ